jgi:uncharacterized protein
MQKKVSRRTFLKKLGKGVIGVILTGAVGYVYSRDIEPKWIETNRYNILHPLIPSAFQNFKIVQFSDTHLGFHLDLVQFEKIMTKISDEKPDLIVFSGDLVDNLLTFVEVEEVTVFLNYLTAPFGKLAVYGNHDHGGYGSEKYLQIMQTSGFTLLKNETIQIRKNNNWITVSGIDDAILGKPDFKEISRTLSNDSFNILISHAPDLADEVSIVPIHLQLSGHTHGGQVQVPFYGPLITPPYGEKYNEGFYNISKDFLLYVNRGLGTTRLPLRFFSRPEITVFTLHTEKSSG